MSTAALVRRGRGLFGRHPVFVHAIQMGDDFAYMHHIGVFMMKVEQVHLMDQFVPVETAFLDKADVQPA